MANQYQQQVQPQYTYQQPIQPLPAMAPVTSLNSPFGLDIKDSQFWKGALLGAAVILLVTNESVQKGVVKTVSKLTAAAQSGIEELKEKFEDAKAEAQAELAAAETSEQ